MDWNTKPAYDSSNMIDYTVASKAVDDSYLSWELTELVNSGMKKGQRTAPSPWWERRAARTAVLTVQYRCSMPMAGTIRRCLRSPTGTTPA